MDTSINAILRENSPALEPIPTDLKSDYHQTSVHGIFFDVYGTLFISQSGDIGVSSGYGSDALFERALIESGIIPSPDYEDSIGALTRSTYFSCIEDEHQKGRSQGIVYPEVDIIQIWDDVLSSLMETGALTEPASSVPIRVIAARYEALAGRAPEARAGAQY